MANKKNGESRYIIKPKLTTWISIIMMLSIFPLGMILPPWWGWENGPIESAQVVILGLSLIFSLGMAWNNRHETEFSKIWMWSAPSWLLMIGRELSWGRVFYPISNGIGEPRFISLQQLWYGACVKPVIAILIIAMIIGLWRSGQFTRFLKTIPISVLDLIIIIIMICLSTVFDKGIFNTVAQYEERFEELSEITMYWAMFSMIFIIGKQQRTMQSTLSGTSKVIRGKG